MYIFPCVILFLYFSVLLVLQLPRLGKRELFLVLFVRLFGLCLFRFVGFLFLLGSGRGCVCNCGTPWTFLLPFLIKSSHQFNSFWKNLFEIWIRFETQPPTTSEQVMSQPIWLNNKIKRDGRTVKIFSLD